MITQPQVYSLIRWGMTIAGTFFGNEALSNGDTQTAVVGGITALLSIIWSFKDGTKTAILAKADKLIEPSSISFDPSNGSK